MQGPPDASETPAEAAAGGEEATRHPVVAWLEQAPPQHLPAQPCSYLPAETARERAFLARRLDGAGYHALMDRGFRRSGPVFYRPECPSCRRCVPLRVAVDRFRPTRSQRRVGRRNADVALQVRTPCFTQATFDLYRRYLAYQHPGSTGPSDAAEFRASYYTAVVDTREAVYTIGEQVVAISLLDVCAQSVSAVYHFFDPDFAGRSLGVHSVLCEIEWARRASIPHYYLGYWIQGAATMDYKAAFGPHELLLDGRWQPAGQGGLTGP